MPEDERIQVKLRVSGREMAPNTFEAALEKMFAKQREELVNLRANVSMTRFGPAGMYVRISDTLEACLSAFFTEGTSTTRVDLAEELSKLAAALVVMERGRWRLPLEDDLGEPEDLREYS